MPKNAFTEQLNESLLDKGLKIIISAFKEQKDEYNNNISLLKSEIKKLQEENFIYKNKLTSLQQKLNSLSKTVLLLDEEVDETKKEEEKAKMETLNTEFHLSNPNLINNNKNNIISRNNNSVLFKKSTIQNKKYLTNCFINENKKINNIKSININSFKRANTNNMKNLKYTINNRDKTSYMKSINYLNNNNSYKNEFGLNISDNSKNKNIANIISKKIDLKEMETSEENNSKLYEQLNLFLEECKSGLNALDYENVVELLNSLETGSDIDIKNKIRKIIYNKHKLIKLFNDIFES